MTATIRSTRRTAPLLVTAALAVGLIGLAPASAAQAGPTSASAPASAAKADPTSVRFRAAIAKAAISQIGKRETGVNYYPATYKLNRDILRPVAWCGVFANWAWYKGNASKRPNMKGKGVDQGHWATYWQKWGKKNNRWSPISKGSPAQGDAIVYGNYPASVHVGIVVDVRRDKKGNVSHVRTVEGNVADKVTDTGWRKITALTGSGKKASGFVSPF